MRRRSWLVLAILLIAAATLLMVYAEEPAPQKQRDEEVRFPKFAAPAELKRMEARRTLPALPPAPGAKDAPPPPERPRDPVLAAIAGGRGSAVVVEANAIRHSPVGELLLECLAAKEGGDPLGRLKERSGVDLLQDLDRVAMTQDGVVLSGFFGKARWDALFEGRATQERYGDKGTVYRLDTRDGGAHEDVFVTWGDQMAIVSESEEQARAAIDRLEGRAAATPVITEDQSYGDIYGVLSADDLSRLLPAEDAELAQRLRSAAQRVELHVDASRDVGIVADVEGQDPSQLEDLGKSIGGALSLARLEAKAEGETELADLLELARVRSRGGGTFTLQMAMPLEMLEKQLAWCRDHHGRAPGRPAQAGAAAGYTQ